ncbi:MAG: heme exporter protein CcmD [Burkholderiales bacterium RIFCSPLOWO2_02_FULL_57_36]|nr:MAG: heme exporter protein CcmD [Burkholderiales bacterium RIFCSPLOWO2_02_FULL_57_36]
MNWGSWSNFFQMGGYGLYVWGSVAMTAVLVVGEVGALRLRRTALLTQYGRWLRAARRKNNEDKA